MAKDYSQERKSKCPGTEKTSISSVIREVKIKDVMGNQFNLLDWHKCKNETIPSFGKNVE